jgi:hypothetical protein
MEMEGNKYLMMVSYAIVFAIVQISYGEQQKKMKFFMCMHTLAQCGTLMIMKCIQTHHRTQRV